MATQPVEDIDAVLGRFQAWTGSREAAGRKPGVRELSDEEALASGRYHWKPDRAGSVKAAPSARSAESVAPPGPDEGRAKTAGVKMQEPKRSGAKRKSQSAARAEVKVKPSARKEEAGPAFREVLAETVLPTQAARPSQVIVKPQPVELSRQVAISIRLAPSERALIKTRAAEAGITASAYIRQCALEVEQLREQVRHAVSAMERGGLSAASVAPSNPSRGFLGWVARRLWPSKSPALALRA